MITTEQIKKLTNKIIKVANPERIILFGSYASDTADENSDLDILVVVKESSLHRRQRAREIRKQFWGLVDIPMDILVYTKKEIHEWSNVPQAFITNIISKGKIIYEK